MASPRKTESPTIEHQRLVEDAARTKNWKRWGSYLAERQWGTVREDYSPDGECWGYFTHEHARSRTYRWGEDGLLGFSDRECRLCFSVALWNGRDPFLKERLFGLSGPEGNHGEDVKECYFYLDATPTHSWQRALYKYPQAEFPYDRLRAESQRRGRSEPEFELLDSGVFDGERYFDVFVSYAKGGPNDLLIELTLANRGPQPAKLHVLPTLWFRNTWSWEGHQEGGGEKPSMRALSDRRVQCDHPSLGRYYFDQDTGPDGGVAPLLFTENETNVERLFGGKSSSPYVKDAFHEFVVGQRANAVNPARTGTKCAAHHELTLNPGEERVLRLRLSSAEEAPAKAFGKNFTDTLAARQGEADEFYSVLLGGKTRTETVAPFAVASPTAKTDSEANRVARQAYAGLLWSKQFYHYVVKDWLGGDPAQPAPPPERLKGRNSDWPHLYARDVISMPDKWEYPWFAAWDLAFHMIPFAKIDPDFAKEQLNLFLREWYMHPSGQIPAYEWNFSDVNPPV
ncbi:MAG: glucosidase, partial [Verrucomicrobia bacterium]|nr:glucosidase [Verrucomicrobiota bacterium]